MFAEIMTAIGLGSQIGGSIYDRWANKDEARDVEARNLHWSKRAIRDRVRDAEKAGIHPLYALGANTTTPQAQAVMSDTGQQIGESINRAIDRPGRIERSLSQQLLEAQILKLQSERALIDQEALRIKFGRGAGSGNADGGIMVDPGGEVVDGQQDSGKFMVEPPKRSTTPPGMPGIESGPGPAFRKYTLPSSGGGLEVLLPAGTDVGETLENVKWYMWPTIYAVNRRHYGEAHADKLLKWANPFK